MAKDTAEIVVGANGTLYVAPTGSTLPDEITDAIDGAFSDLGYLSEDGVTMTDGKTIEDIPVWQLFYAARKIVTERSLDVAFVLRQFAKDQVELAFGGSVAEDPPASSSYKLTPPNPEDIDERAIIVHWLDGGKTYRLVIPKAIVSEDVETQMVRTAAQDLPITMSLVGEDGVEPWYILTDDPAWA